MTQDLSDLTAALLDAAQKAGADGADALAVDGTSLSISVHGGALEQAERSEGVDIGLRVFVGQRQACVSASDHAQATITDMAERAVAMAKLSPEDPHIRQATPAEFTTNTDCRPLDMFDASAEPSAADLQEVALEAESAALAVAGVSQVQAASAGYGSRRIHLATSQGFAGGYQRTDHGLSCVAISGTGLDMQRDYDGDFRVYRSDLRNAAEIGRIAAERAIAMQGAQKPPTGAVPVLFDERISSTLIGHVLAASNGANVARGSTWLRDKLGEQILPKNMTLTETPLRPRATGSKLFDAEGLATADRAIIEDGVLTGWTLDLATAQQLGLSSTANASRGPGGPPSPSNGNMWLTHGETDRAGLLAQMGTGLLVTSLIGSSVNPTTGDYSRGASGFWVENGEITYPVQECTIAGNLLDMLQTIVPANDGRAHLSRVIPSLLVEGLTVAGA